MKEPELEEAIKELKEALKDTFLYRILIKIVDFLARLLEDKAEGKR